MRARAFSLLFYRVPWVIIIAMKLSQGLSERIRYRPFSAIGIVTLLIYGLFLWFYGNDPHHYGRMTRELFIWPSLISLLAVYIWGYYSLKKHPQTPVVLIIAFGGFIALMALLITPFHSTDIYGYINRGWQQLSYGLNPYTSVVDDIPNWDWDKMITNHWVNNPCPYGFLFALIAKWLCIPAQGNLDLTALVFKGFNLLIHGGIGWLVWLSARHLNFPHPERSLYLYLWNPLILLHQLSNGHNDIVMAFFITLAGFLVIRRAWLWVIPALVAATLVKYAAIVLIPLAFIYIIHHKGWHTALESSLIGGILFLAIGGTFLGDIAQMPLDKISANATITHGSFHSVFYSLYKEITKLIPFLHDSRETIRSLLKYLILMVYAGFYGIQLWQATRKPLSRPAFIQQSTLILFGLIGFASLKFYPWYLSMFFPLALMLPSGNLVRRFILVLSGFQLFAFTFIGQAHILNYLLLTGAPIGIILWAKKLKQDQPPPKLSASTSTNTYITV